MEYLKKYGLLILPAIAGILGIVGICNDFAHGYMPIASIIQAVLLLGGVCLVVLSGVKQGGKQGLAGYVMLAVWLVLALLGLLLSISRGLFDWSYLLSITQKGHIAAAYQHAASEKKSTGTSYLDAYKKSKKQ